MRVLSYFSFVFVLLLVTIGTQAQSQPSATKDSQGVLILQQALTTAGGAGAISAIKDYTGSGTLIFHQSQNDSVSGTVTISGRWLDQFRIDETVPSGIRSLIFNQGRIARKREDGTVSRFPPQGKIPSSDAFPWQTQMFSESIGFPYLQMVTALNNPQFSIIYRGLLTVNGKSAHDVQISQVPPTTQDQGGYFANYHNTDLFIDSVTFQIIAIQGLLPKDVVHQVWYSNYAPVSNVLVPFSITEQMGGQKIRDIYLTQISFNTGLQDSNFNLP
jgi:hypothetical protein